MHLHHIASNLSCVSTCKWVRWWDIPHNGVRWWDISIMEWDRDLSYYLERIRTTHVWFKSMPFRDRELLCVCTRFRIQREPEIDTKCVCFTLNAWELAALPSSDARESTQMFTDISRDLLQSQSQKCTAEMLCGSLDGSWRMQEKQTNHF